MMETEKHVGVVVVGAGVAGLTVGNFLRRNGIECVVLERRSREYVEVEGGFFIDGQAMPIEVDEDDNESMFIPQQVLVRRLADIFLREGGDIRYEVEGGLADIPRGTENSRIYLQCPNDDTVAQWPDERIWDELEARVGQFLGKGEILSKEIVALRSIVYDPMRYGRVYLLGDAAHIVPPMSAKGIHSELTSGIA
jgi:2-polyprenyl-6-methoxyphenol hydroxylase-like FAD-dependent oxidoreductase